MPSAKTSAGLPTLFLLKTKKKKKKISPWELIGRLLLLESAGLNVGMIKSLRESKPVSANPRSNKGFLKYNQSPSDDPRQTASSRGLPLRTSWPVNIELSGFSVWTEQNGGL